MKTMYSIVVTLLVLLYFIKSTRATFFEKKTEIKKNLKEFQKLKLSLIECTIKCNIIDKCEVSGIVDEYCVLYELNEYFDTTKEYSPQMFIEKMQFDERVTPFSREYQPKFNYLFDTIKLLKKNWIVSMDIKPIGNDGVAYKNVIHFTINGDFGYGYRTPTLFLFDNTLHITSAIDDNPNHTYDYNISHAIQTFTKVNIKQELLENVCYFSIQINNTIVHRVINTKAQEFDNVKVYLSSPWFDAAKVVIRNFLYYTW